MNSATLTEEQKKIMWYPQSIIEWEVKHGIARCEQNWMLYVRGQFPESVIFESIRREQKQIKEHEERERRRKRSGNV